ncbi:MAG TPA: tRNA (adenosine(37)-N6)-threonylcarbamoyltransferase complex ATPase subunit type 1 TsaE [Vicinamibacterales bacterium]|nr:tRNA (adenosine(37)-N6)-threonylcarbamoyltransferase complex ATPase subunit type 1 TsaE [Vicinamibacterales bacterium]
MTDEAPARPPAPAAAPTSVDTAGEAGTRAVAAALAATLAAGDVVLLHGDLGAGKTVFVKGLAVGLGLDPDAVTSPTFTLVHEYAGGRLPLVHLDLYRIDRIELDDVGFDPALADAGVLVVEWAERLTRVPAGAVVVQLYDAGGDARRLEVVRPLGAAARGYSVR